MRTRQIFGTAAFLSANKMEAFVTLDITKHRQQQSRWVSLQGPNLPRL